MDTTGNTQAGPEGLKAKVRKWIHNVDDRLGNFLLPALIVLAVVIVVLVGLFVWPTPYRYQTIYLGMIGKQLIRTNRITLASEICGPHIWEKIAIVGDRITFPGEIQLVVGEITCPRTPAAVTVILIVLGVVELLLIALLVLRSRRRKMEPTAIAESLAVSSIPVGIPVEAVQLLQQAEKSYEKGAKFEAILQLCDSAIQAAPQWADVHNFRGIVLQDMGRLEEAIQAYHEAVRLDPTCADAVNNLNEAQAARPLQN